jgi:hypothetical protein
MNAANLADDIIPTEEYQTDSGIFALNIQSLLVPGLSDLALYYSKMKDGEGARLEALNCSMCVIRGVEVGFGNI